MNISDFCHAIEKPWIERPAFKSAELNGIALRFDSYCGGLDNYNGYEDDEWEDGQELTSAFFHMVGDDRLYEIEIEDIEILDDDEFCGGCGQIGCGHG
jgi:hypothetical protein